MASTNIRLLTRKIEALDADAQRAVELAVDSLLDDAPLAPAPAGDARIATLERRVDALGDQNHRDEVVVLDEHDADLPDLRSAIEHLIDAGHRTLGALVPGRVGR